MEATIVQMPVSHEEQTVVYHAARACQAIQEDSNLIIEVNEFFSGFPKPHASVEAAVHDAVIYHCYKTLNATMPATVVARALRLSPQQLLEIIWQHQLKVQEGKNFYYRLFTRKLGHNDSLAEIAIPLSQKTFHTKAEINTLVTIVLSEVARETAVSESDISGKSHQKVTVRSRRICLNILLALLWSKSRRHRKASLDTIGSFIDCDYSLVIYHRKKHNGYLKECKTKEPPGDDAIEYQKLYNSIALRVKERIAAEQ